MISLRHPDNLRELPHDMRHDIFHQSKLWVYKQGMSVLYILIPTIELQVPDHLVIHTIDHGVSMLFYQI